MREEGGSVQLSVLDQVGEKRHLFRCERAVLGEVWTLYGCRGLLVRAFRALSRGNRASDFGEVLREALRHGAEFSDIALFA